MSKIAQKCSEGNIETSELFDKELYDDGDTKRKYRAYVFTSFAENPPDFNEDMKYLLYAPETCPTTNRKHWQGYVYWKNQKSIKASNKCLDKIWCKPAKGDTSSQEAYIKGPYTKNDKTKPANPDFKEFGIKPEQGKRTDLNALKEEIIEGLTVDQIVMDNPMVFHQYGRTLERIQNIVNRRKHRTWMTKGYWYWGETGVGKSHIAFDGFDPDTHYVYNISDNGFWNGYTGQEIVIINELRGQIPFSELLDLVDIWPKWVKVKGGEQIPFLAKEVRITSCNKPEDVYYNCFEHNESIKEFDRRFTTIKVIKK